MAPVILTEQNCWTTRLKKWISQVNPILAKSDRPKNATNVSSSGLHHALSLKDYTLSFYDSMKEVPNDWDQIAPADNLFLQRTYLQLLEDHPPTEMRFCYFLFYRNRQVVGLAIGQIQYFKADRSLSKEHQKTPGYFNTFARYLKEMVASRVEFITLVCGNLLLTGEHGFHFSQGIDPEKRMELLQGGLKFAQKALDKQGICISATLTKDIYEPNRSMVRKLLDYSFREFTVQPSMILDNRWNSFEEYCQSLQSKYRVRMKRAFKKAKDITKRNLSLEEIEAHLPRLYELYEGIAANSGFNLINLNQDYLLALKQHFPERFQLQAYFLEDELIAYYTSIHNGTEMEAHFLGYDHAYNHSHQVYLNILFDLTKLGIELGVERLVFARTALEIKSSIGAKPHEMYCYFRHRSTFSNNFVRPILDYLRPQVEWKERHPFKD
ncbi:MAG: GNAT family N-acetyltransferase [Bacteroidota bacterium]